MTLEKALKKSQTEEIAEVQMKEINNQETKNRRNDKNGKESQMMDRKMTTGKDSLGT